jgi:Bardet-Biedl syndrome 9 protein
VVSTFLTSDGVPHSLHQAVQLPLALAIRPCPPVKDADFKVTVSTNKPAVSLLELFPEFVLDSSMTNAAGFQLYGGAVITVLSSKTSQRYRLQSENLAAIWTITSHVLRRLQARFPTDLHCEYTSSLPLQEFYMEIDSHFTRRRQRNHVMETLAQRTAQFRAIERRLLTRFKDKTPSALTNLDMLLEGTHRQVLQSAEAVEAHYSQLERSAADLSCTVRLLLLLARLSVGIPDEEYGKLEAALTPLVHTGQEQGWEETTDAALTFLLRTSLAKPGRENQGATPITLDPVKETTRIKKHVSSVMDRITKGGKLADLQITPDTSPFIDSVTNSDSFDHDEPELEVVGRAVDVATPMGSR